MFVAFMDRPPRSAAGSECALSSITLIDSECASLFVAFVDWRLKLVGGVGCALLFMTLIDRRLVLVVGVKCALLFGVFID
ncbi:hypothetical protein GCM10027087_42610 [Paractinoplanes abujensis]